jgi:signal transduction histidine kinase
LITSLVEAAQVRAQAKEVELVQEVGAVDRLGADHDLLRRVLENLLDNALRYAPKGSRIAVSALAHEGEVELRVADEGQGVPADLREGIFERFAQLESGQRSAPRTGRGLGLTFCRLAVEAQGGRIYVEDGTPGAIFCIRLPHRA